VRCFSKFSDSPKSDPADVVRQVLDGIEAGDTEVLADELSRRARAWLSEPVEDRLARLMCSPGTSQ
jgi:hypothetical protein